MIDILDPGGTERVFVDLCNILNRYDIDVSVLFTRRPGILSIQLNKKIPQLSLNRKYRYSIIAIFKLINIIRKYDIIHIHGRYNFLYVKIIMLFYPFKKWQVYFHDHYGAIEIDQSVPKIFKLINKNYNYIGVSKSLTEWASDKLKLENEQIYLLSNIRDIQTKDIHQSKDELIMNNSIELVQVSNIHPIKNIEFSIKLLHELKITKQVKLTVYGQVNDRSYFKSLILLAERLNLEEDLLFIHDQFDIPSILNKYDLGICTSKSESGPLVLIEYLSRGLPFISYKTGEVVRQLVKEQSSFIIDNFNEKLWVKRIMHILNDQSINKEYLINIFNKYYSHKSYYNSLLNIYK